MRSRQPLPRVWLMTDERADATLERALARLPRGAGIVFRHYRTPPAERRTLYERVRRIARRRGLLLVLAGSAAEAKAWRADGVHGDQGPRALVRTISAHDTRELQAARGADAVFLSPLFATRSHPGGGALGPLRFAALARRARARVIALGGMDARRFARVRRLGAYGWAGIDAWHRISDAKAR